MSSALTSVVGQQLDLARLQHVVHGQLITGGQLLKQADGVQLVLGQPGGHLGWGSGLGQSGVGGGNEGEHRLSYRLRPGRG